MKRGGEKVTADCERDRETEEKKEARMDAWMEEEVWKQTEDRLKRE